MGGTLEFGDRSVRIGAVVPEELIGWSEMLVSREVGVRLGIVDDRYLWAFPERPTLDAFERLVHSSPRTKRSESRAPATVRTCAWRTA